MGSMCSWQPGMRSHVAWEHQWGFWCCCAAVSLLVCTACNLASPIITGFLFEMLVGRSQYSLQRYPAFFALFAAVYITEPLLTRIYIKHMCAAGEKVSTHDWHCSLYSHILTTGAAVSLINMALRLCDRHQQSQTMDN